MRTLITGGVKSGKSRYALILAEAMAEPRGFLATAVAFDDHMKDKIERHKRERGNGFETVEEPIEIHEAVRENMVVDCITVWMNNLFFSKCEERWETILDVFLSRLGQNAIIVTNETGLGNIPMDPDTRRYNELLSAANRRIAEAMDQVIIMVTGLPLVLKDAKTER